MLIMRKFEDYVRERDNQLMYVLRHNIGEVF